MAMAGNPALGRDETVVDAPSFTAELTLDEFRYLVELTPPIPLPVSLTVGSLGGSSTSDDDLDRRRTSARIALETKNLLTVPAGRDDPTELRHPLLLLALALPLAAQHAIQVQSWTPGTSSETLICVADGIASTVTITLERSDDLPSTQISTARDGVVRIVLGSLALIVEAIEGLLEGTPREPGKVEPLMVEVGLVESRSIIEAIRSGDPAVVDQVAGLFDALAALPLLRSLAATMEAGIRIRAYDHGILGFTADWVQSESGEWIGFRLLGSPDANGETTAQSVVDSARVELTRRRRNMVGADLISLVSSYQMEASIASR